MKKSKNNNIILGFSFMYLVSVDAKDRSLDKKKLWGKMWLYHLKDWYLK